MTVPGGTTTEPITFYYRDGLEVFKNILSDPSYRGSMDFIPRRVWQDHRKQSRVYDEIMTADFAWDIQVCVQRGIQKLTNTANLRYT